jgi:transposase
LETAQAAAEASVEPAAAEAKPKSKPSRKPLPAHLPDEVVTHHPERDCCPDCGEALRNFGGDVAEILEYIPANFKVIRHVRPKFACTDASVWSKRLRHRA